MELKDGDIYENISSSLKFTLKQETPVAWSLNFHSDLKDYPIYPEKYMISLLEKNFIKLNTKPPYSKEEYQEAKQQGLDLDDWNDYVKYFGIGEEEEYE